MQNESFEERLRSEMIEFLFDVYIESIFEDEDQLRQDLSEETTDQLKKRVNKLYCGGLTEFIKENVTSWQVA